MIECTFQHVSGIFEKGEQQLWRANIKNWAQLLSQPSPIPHFSKKKWQNLRKEISTCQRALEKEDYAYFLTHMPENLHWRLFPSMRGKILYLDAEMTGLIHTTDHITTISTFDGTEIRWFIAGENLDDFPPYLDRFPAICTFDGDRVDLCFIERELGVHIYQVHFDLFKLSRQLHYTGGLKDLESQFGVLRPGLEQFSGESAIFLWDRYQQTQKRAYLETLLAYNIEDAINLEPLLHIFFEQLRQTDRLPIKSITYAPKNTQRPFRPDANLLEK